MRSKQRQQIILPLVIATTLWLGNWAGWLCCVVPDPAETNHVKQTPPSCHGSKAEVVRLQPGAMLCCSLAGALPEASVELRGSVQPVINAALKTAWRAPAAAAVSPYFATLRQLPDRGETYLRHCVLLI